MYSSFAESKPFFVSSVASSKRFWILVYETIIDVERPIKRLIKATKAILNW
ncbi:hypothetical protein [Wukongibacter baidiensis]